MGEDLPPSLRILEICLERSSLVRYMVIFLLLGLPQALPGLGLYHGLDTTGSYQETLIVFSCMFIVSLTISLLIRLDIKKIKLMNKEISGGNSI